MDNEIVKINNHELGVKEFNGERVITFEDVDRVHERPKGTASRNFRKNRERFIENVDYFHLSYEEIRSTNFVERPNSQGLILITESGYLMLVKSFTDDLAWKVQRQLVNSYFRYKDILPKNEFDVMRAVIDQLEEIKYGIRIAEEKSNKAINKIDALESKVDVTIQNDYVKANDIARDLGLYSEGGLPHSQIIGKIARKLKYKIDYKRYYQDEYIAIVGDKDKNSWEVYYKPIAVDEITEWFNKNKDKAYYEILYKRNCKGGNVGEVKEKGYEIGGTSFKVK